jgi:beta-phosphoglucomutase-like phosphatase (HAD superfamily)
MRCDRLPRIRACLFDMDGLLLNTEDIYTFITNSILHDYGKPNLPWSIKAQLQGRPAPEVRTACSCNLRRLIDLRYQGRQNFPRLGKSSNYSG